MVGFLCLPSPFSSYQFEFGTMLGRIFLVHIVVGNKVYRSSRVQLKWGLNPNLLYNTHTILVQRVNTVFPLEPLPNNRYHKIMRVFNCVQQLE